MSVPEINCQELKDLIDAKAAFELIDVREEHEYEFNRIEGSKWIPLGELESRINELDPKKSFVMQCRSGARSAEAARILLANGFTDVRNLVGGINLWAVVIDPTIPQY